MPRPLYSRETIPGRSEQQTAWAPETSGCSGEEKNSALPTDICRIASIC